MPGRAAAQRIRKAIALVNEVADGAGDEEITPTEIAEAITHLAFYVGWPNVFSAMPMAKDVFEKRPR